MGPCGSVLARSRSLFQFFYLPLHPPNYQCQLLGGEENPLSLSSSPFISLNDVVTRLFHLICATKSGPLPGETGLDSAPATAPRPRLVSRPWRSQHQEWMSPLSGAQSLTPARAQPAALWLRCWVMALPPCVCCGLEPLHQPPRVTPGFWHPAQSASPMGGGTGPSRAHPDTPSRLPQAGLQGVEHLPGLCSPGPRPLLEGSWGEGPQTGEGRMGS